MPFSPDVFSRIALALGEKREKGTGEHSPLWPCPFCRSTSWTLGDGFVTLILSYGTNNFQPFSSTLPSLALICQVCGHTMLFNLVALGLGDLVGYLTPQAAEG